MRTALRVQNGIPNCLCDLLVRRKGLAVAWIGRYRSLGKMAFHFLLRRGLREPAGSSESEREDRCCGGEEWFRSAWLGHVSHITDDVWICGF